MADGERVGLAAISLKEAAWHAARGRRQLPEGGMLGASGDGKDSLARIQKFAAEQKMTFPIWLGANGSDLVAFGLDEALPGTAVLDREGRMVWSRSGMVSGSELKAQIEKALGPAPKS